MFVRLYPHMRCPLVCTMCVFTYVCERIMGVCSTQGGPQQRSTGVCLLQCSGQRRSTQPTGIVIDINKFLMGLQWGRERQLQQGRGGGGQRVDDDTNRSISSIEEDFLTASEHLGDDSEDDGFRNGESWWFRF